MFAVLLLHFVRRLLVLEILRLDFAPVLDSTRELGTLLGQGFVRPIGVVQNLAYTAVQLLGVEKQVVAVRMFGVVRPLDGVKALTYVAAQVLGLWRALHLMSSQGSRLLFGMLSGEARLFDFAPEIALALSLVFGELIALVYEPQPRALGVLRLLLAAAASRAILPDFEPVLVVVRLRAFGVLLLFDVA